MVIQSSKVAMQGSSDYKRTDNVTVTSVRTTNVALMTAEELAKLGLEEEDPAATLELNEDGSAKEDKTKSIYSPKKLTGTGSFGDWEVELKSQLIKAFLKALQRNSSSSQFGELIESLKNRLGLTGLQDDNQTDKLSELWQKMNSSGNNGQGRQVLQQQPAFRVVSTSGALKVSRETFIENSMSFSTKAQVKTSDGRQIDIDLQLNMSQSFYEKFDFESVFNETVVSNNVLKDPLVINFDLPSAALDNTKFEFDLDFDGSSDNISRLAKGSGFLSYDKDGNGSIDDGSELFGAATGNGFSELAAYDQDGNGWIDEADDIFGKLSVWTINDDGTHTLFGLGDLGIGAIYLGSVETDYALGNLNDPDGIIRRTGFFLYENGNAGTIQHVDLKV